MAGTIVAPRVGGGKRVSSDGEGGGDGDGGGGSDHHRQGWHSVFLPDGGCGGSTVGEMTEGSDEREACLPRGAAIQALEVGTVVGEEDEQKGVSCMGRTWCLG